MQTLLNRLDALGGIEQENVFARWLERIAFIFLILMILSAPHSIAATQTAWLLGMATTIVRLLVKPRLKIFRTPLDIALWTFFGWTAVTSVFSYAPDISLDKLKGALLFLIFYFVLYNLRNIRAAKFLAFTLIFSCMASIVWAPIERIYGRGVEVSGISADSPLAKGVYFNHDIYLATKGKNLRAFDDSKAGEEKPSVIIEGDAIVEVEGRKIRTLDDLAAEIEKNETTYLECFRAPNYFTVKVRREDLLGGATALEKLGISGWKHNRTWRYAGFYGQIITYAEVLQMIASLALGLFLALGRKRSPARIILGLCVVGMIFALLMTFTRATQAAFLASAIAMVCLVANRKLILTLAIIGLPLALAGFFFVQQNRNLDSGKRDESVEYRQTIYREGFNLWTSSARNFLLGIGMDSTRRFAKDWHLFDDGRLQMSHFHSTPLQLLVERGLPALALWFWILWLYAGTLLRSLKLRITNYELRDDEIQNSTTTNPQSAIRNPQLKDWQTRGIILGCFGGLVGFFSSSLVNYSLGDSEVAMVFFMLMGISVSLIMQNAKLKMQN